MGDTRHRRAVKAKVPPRAVYLAVWECGAFRCLRSAESARFSIEMNSDTCCAVGGHAARVIAYRRSSLYGRGRATWKPRVIEGGSQHKGDRT